MYIVPVLVLIGSFLVACIAVIAMEYAKLCSNEKAHIHKAKAAAHKAKKTKSKKEKKPFNPMTLVVFLIIAVALIIEILI